MKKLSLALLLALALITPAFAKTFNLPDEGSFASITIPDSWKSKEIDKGVESQSSDSEVYIAVEATDAKGMDKTIEEAIDFLQQQGVTIDPKSAKQSDGKINGMDGVDITWTGKDKEGDAIVSLTILAVTPNKVLLITYWGSPSGTKNRAKEIGEILNSVKSLVMK
jgi:hypothetical protein